MNVNMHKKNEVLYIENLNIIQLIHLLCVGLMHGSSQHYQI